MYITQINRYPADLRWLQPSMVAHSTVLARPQQTFDYAKADPLLNHDELQVYQASESRWQAFYQTGIVARRLTPQTRPPTKEDVEHLKKLIEASDVDIKILSTDPEHDKCGFTAWSFAKNKPVIYLTRPYINRESDRQMAVQILSHEYLHALHYQRNPAMRESSMEACEAVNEIENIIIESLENHRQIKDWSKIFKEFTVPETLETLTTKDLKSLKTMMLTEASAYGLTAHLSGYENLHKGWSTAYIAAIQLINSEINGRANQVNKTTHAVKL